jgi:hypothetical protein
VTALNDNRVFLKRQHSNGDSNLFQTSSGSAKLIDNSLSTNNTTCLRLFTIF